MIPRLVDVIAAHTFLTRRYQLSGYRNDAVFSAAITEARTLATHEEDEPAALFYAFARRGKALRDAWAHLTDLLALNQLHAQGRGLHVTRADLRSLRTRTATGQLEYEDVRGAFMIWCQPIM